MQLSDVCIPVRVREQFGLSPTGHWVDHVAGSLADVLEDEYQQFLDYCRAVRDDISNSEGPQP